VAAQLPYQYAVLLEDLPVLGRQPAIVGLEVVDLAAGVVQITGQVVDGLVGPDRGQRATEDGGDEDEAGEPEERTRRGGSEAVGVVVSHADDLRR
jgi:hypothetical protein